MNLAYYFLLIASFAQTYDAKGAEVSLSGKAVPGMESADTAYAAFMKTHGIPGGSATTAFKDLDITMWKAVRGVKKWPQK